MYHFVGLKRVHKNLKRPNGGKNRICHLPNSFIKEWTILYWWSTSSIISGAWPCLFSFLTRSLYARPFAWRHKVFLDYHLECMEYFCEERITKTKQPKTQIYKFNEVACLRHRHVSEIELYSGPLFMESHISARRINERAKLEKMSVYTRRFNSVSCKSRALVS